MTTEGRVSLLIPADEHTATSSIVPIASKDYRRNKRSCCTVAMVQGSKINASNSNWSRRSRRPRVQGSKGPSVHAYERARVQGSRSTRIQGSTRTSVQEYKGARVQECKGARVLESKSPRVHWSNCKIFNRPITSSQPAN